MEKRRIREFQRLLSRSESLDDIDLLNNNIAELNKQFSDLVKDKLLETSQEKEYSAKIQKIQTKLAPKIASPKKKDNTKKFNLQNSEQDIEKERLKHTEITNDILVLSSQLKDTVSAVSTKVAVDEEVMNTVQDSLESVSAGAEKTGIQMNTTLSERFGFGIYFQFGFVILVYVLVTIVF